MRNFLRIEFLVLVVTLFGGVAVAQNGITAPYFYGFEATDTIEQAKWTFNPGPNAATCEDQWVIGTATHNGGRQALYISNDEGVSARFGASPNVQYVYRDFTIPAGVYDVSFDWRCLGSPNTEFFAGIAPYSNALNTDMRAISTSQSAVVPASVKSWCDRKAGNMSGTTLWKNASISLNSNGTTTYRLFFVWRSNNRDTTLAMPLGGCIDNIQITSANCKKPSNLQARTQGCDSVLVSWTGTSAQYALEYKRRGQSRWTVVSSSIATEQAVLEGLDEGLYDLRVRGICNVTDTSAYAYLNSFAVFCPAAHCINYVDLHDSTIIECTYGTFNNPRQSIGVVDYGSEDKYSRHTVNWEPDTYDPRTCNQLPTIPDDELASIRLGNWNNGAEAECISFRYVADLQNAAILLLKYAVVLEDPDHGASSQPRFSLEILDEWGNLISPTCGAEDFYASADLMGQQGWHTCGSAPGATSPVRWKEWTTIGLNLEEVGVQDGDLLTIRLTTKDCSASAHFGYAYFTLGCAAAKLTGKSCGNESSLAVEAPEGFNYEWYDKYNNLVSTDKTLSVEPSDTTTYRCRLSYIGNSECDFNLYTAVQPRFPIPAFTYSYEPSDCQNKVRFTNRSHVMTVFNNDTVFHYNEGLESYTWDFGNGVRLQDKSPVYVFPNSGGTFPVTLIGSISNGACEEDTTLYITLPQIGDTEQFIDTVICENSYIVFDKYYAGEAGEYRVEKKSVAGCDSVITLRLGISPVTDVYVGDTIICADETLTVDGQTYKHNFSAEFVRFYKNAYNCDSVLRMNVTVLDSILTTASMHDVEGDLENSGYLTLEGTGYTYYTLNGEKNAPLTGLNGGNFILRVFNDYDCMVEYNFDMSYPCHSLIFQRWDDVLSVLNEQYQKASAGKKVSPLTYQWMRNGDDIPGATLSYLFVPEKLNPADVYEVRIVTMDGEELISCPYVPELLPSTPQPEAAKFIDQQRVVIMRDGVKYNVLGEKL